MRQVVNPKTSAILVIDMQNGFVEPGAVFCIKGAKATIPAIAKAIETGRDAGTKIIWVTRSYDEDMSNMEIPRREYLIKQGITGVLSPGSKGINSIEDAKDLVRKPEDISIIKLRFSAFFETDLREILKKNDIKTLILTGTTTPNCIRATAYDGISYDYEVIALKDCCSSNSREIQDANMNDMAAVGVKIVRSEDIIYE